jgi:hypothetical protein
MYESVSAEMDPDVEAPPKLRLDTCAAKLDSTWPALEPGTVAFVLGLFAVLKDCADLVAGDAALLPEKKDSMLPDSLCVPFSDGAGVTECER